MRIIETPPQHLFTVAEYMTLDTADRTELLDGVIYDVSPRNEPHRYAVRFLTETLELGFQRRYTLQFQDAIAVAGWHGKDAPEVDVAILNRKRYDPIPTSNDALTFMEISDTTYAFDRKRKVPLYVSAGVPAWIVNIPLRQVEFYESKDDLELEHGRVFTDLDTIDILGVVIRVCDLF